MTTDAPALTETDEDAIRELVARASAAQDDTDGLLALHTADTVIVNIAGRRVLGREALGTAMAAALSSPLRDVRTEVEVVDVRPVTADVALVSCIKTVHDGRAGTERTALPATGALTYVLTRGDGGWLVALAQTTPIAGG
jgi:uncharacterized protein (TIGR02246 family)